MGNAERTETGGIVIPTHCAEHFGALDPRDSAIAIAVGELLEPRDRAVEYGACGVRWNVGAARLLKPAFGSSGMVSPTSKL